MDPLWKQINEAIHGRDLVTVYDLIPKYLKNSGSSPEAVYEASEFYRKISDYRAALRVLPVEPVNPAISPHSSEIHTKLELQLARILSILGATGYAIRMVERIRKEDRAKSKIEMVEIYHCNDRYAEVIDLLGEDFPIPDVEPWHQDWLLHFYYATSLNGLGQFDRAIERVEQIHALSAVPLIRAMTLCYKGKYLVSAGRAKEALPVLLESKKWFLETDPTSDHAVLQLNLGKCHLKLKNYEQAEIALKKAFAAFYQQGLKPEDWMEIVIFLDQIPGYRDPSEHLAPRLWAMEGPTFPPLWKLGFESCGDPNDIFSILKKETSRKLRHIERESDTAWVNEKARLGLDLVDELVSHLVYAGEFGLPQYRLYELLWPNEPFSFDQHKKRLENLVLRARAEGNQIAWKDLHLRLESADITVTGRPGNIIRGGSFLKKHPVFTRRDVEKFFAVSNTTAKVLCREWIEAGHASSLNKSQYQSRLS
jgi:tetratricopeptide (TPR) repeat protein